MTKRNLLLVSLFLVFGLVAMATSALAGTQWVTGSSPLPVRAQGLTEETGIYTFTLNTAGSVINGEYFTVGYPGMSVVPSSQFIQCTGPDFTNAPSCAPILTASIVTIGGVPTVKVLFTNTTSPTPFVNTQDELIVVVRINAHLLTCGSDFNATGGTVNAVASPNSLSLSASSVTSLPVLHVICDPAVLLSLGTEHGKLITEPPTVLTCQGVKDVANYDNEFTLNIKEAFGDALTSESFENASDPYPSGSVTNGTEIIVTFYNVPEGMGLANTDVKPCSTLWTGNPLYCPDGTLDAVLDKHSCTDDPVVTGYPATKTCTFDFDVIQEDNLHNAESIDLKFKFWSHGQLPPGLWQMTANVSKGPTAAPAVPRFAVVQELPALPGLPGLGGLSVVEFSDCRTVLLYPYLTTSYGWGSGVAVANTTMDPFKGDPAFGRGAAVPQNGPCTFYLYGTDVGKGLHQSTLTPWTTVLSGQTLAMDVGSAGWTPALPAGGASAYAIAVCDFQNAHGYAILYYNLLGDNGIAADYLADVLPNPQWYHRSPAGDMLGETAIAPYWINKQLLKLINYGSSCCH